MHADLRPPALDRQAKPENGGDAATISSPTVIRRSGKTLSGKTTVDSINRLTK